MTDTTIDVAKPRTPVNIPIGICLSTDTVGSCNRRVKIIKMTALVVCVIAIILIIWRGAWSYNIHKMKWSMVIESSKFIIKTVRTSHYTYDVYHIYEYGYNKIGNIQVTSSYPAIVGQLNLLNYGTVNIIIKNSEMINSDNNEVIATRHI